MSLRTLPSSILAGALSLSALTMVASAASFSDVPSTHPNAEAIAYVKAQGIVSGYPNGTFKPDQEINRFDQPITRGEMAEMIWRLKAGVTTKPSRTYEELAASDGWATTTNQQLGIRFEHPTNAKVSSVEQRKTTDGTTINELTVTPTGMDQTRVHFFSTNASFDQAKNIQILWNYQNQESEFGNAIIDGRAGTRRIDHSPNNDCTHEVTVVEKSGVVYGFAIIQCPSHPEGFDQLRRDIANSLELL